MGFRNHPLDRQLALPPEALRWRCDPALIPGDSTEDIEPVSGVVGQDDAMEALRFGLEIDAPGQNIFVRGLTGTGRMSLVKQLMEQIQPACPLASDRLYVHNFSHPDRPRLLSLPRGRGRIFQRAVDTLIEFIEEDLLTELSAESVRTRRSALDNRLQEELRTVGEPFEAELQTHNLALVPIQVGQSMQPVIMPLMNGEPVSPEQFRELRQKGSLSNDEATAIQRQIEEFSGRFQELGEKIAALRLRHRADVSRLLEKEARTLLNRQVQPILEEFPFDTVKRFLDEVVGDLVEHRLRNLEKQQGFTRLYRVNLILGHGSGDPCPFIIENTPTLPNLLGNIEREFGSKSMVYSDHMMIRAGTLLRADGGYVILEARDLLSDPGAWKLLVRTLRTGKLEIQPTEFGPFVPGPVLKPEPIPIQVKVVLLGDPRIYYLLDAADPDFPHLFKVLADFDTSIPRDARSIEYYAKVISRIVREERLFPFDRQALAALCEHGARVAATDGRLTTRFGRIADIAREASHHARRAGLKVVAAEQVEEAIRFIRRRADLPARQFRKLVRMGTIRVQTRGRVVGQVNGLAVIHAGPLTYGFPSRITATLGPGTAGAINIERESQLSGAIHTKGFYILGGLLRHLLRTDHPLAFSASVAFEQSYGGIDGDSASGAEVCCLLSALTDVPLRQDLAMTGAIDQLGHVQPIGAVTEKIEGFFDVCRDGGLTGSQGVIIPRANAAELMLRADVVEACARGEFHIHAVDSVAEALELFTGREVGSPDESGAYPADSLLERARTRAREFWRMASRNPGPFPDAPA